MASGTVETAPGGSAPAPPARARISARTLRVDRWWVPPLLTVVGITAWLVYGLVRVFMQKWYWVDEFHYLTPFYSPCTSTGCVPDAAHFGRFTPDWPILPYAALSLPFLLLFRFTCYYYRRAYYRAYWLSPPACAVAEPHRRYTGETRFPLVVQNTHRYFFYIAIAISLINTYDAIIAFHGKDGGFGFGLGNVILVANVVLLWAYTLSCHSCRHIIGGRLRHFSKHPLRYRAWGFVSWMNTRHMLLAWVTLGTLALTDAYVMAVAAGWFSDLRFIN
jgi:hypothetical protein